MQDDPLTPKLQALVLADHVYVDRYTGKKVIAGTFTTLHAEQLPSEFPRDTFAFVSLVGLRGKVEVQLAYVDNSDLQVLMLSPVMVIEGRDPFVSQEMVLQVPRLPMPHEGSFDMRLLVNGQQLGAIRVSVQQVEGGGET